MKTPHYSKKSMPCRIILGIIAGICLLAGLYFGAIAMFHVGISPTEISEASLADFVFADGGIQSLSLLLVVALLAIPIFKR